MNTITFTGRLTANPELRTTSAGPVTEVRVAINNQAGTTYVPVTAWGKLAETLTQFQRRGSQVAVTGRLAQDEWEADGQRRSRLHVVARSIDFLERPSDSSPSAVTEGDA